MRSAGLLLMLGTLACGAAPARQTEALDRGVVARVRDAGGVFVSWRLLAQDPPGARFEVLRGGVRLTPSPGVGPTCWVDPGGRPGGHYTVRLAGRREASAVATAWAHPYLEIPVEAPPGYRPNDASVGDLDGDGAYEIVLHVAGRGHDNSQPGVTDRPLLDAYTLAGRRLWRIDLGPNIREGAHYTQFMVYDLDGDGRAEVACKTADGSVDGTGYVLGDPQADWRNDDGYVLAGPEFLTVFEGLTGAAMATVPYVPPRHPMHPAPTPAELKAVWGDGYGNRVDRFLACVAYLDGERPSLVMCRGYYTRTVLAAWDWRQGRLRQRWTFDSGDGSYAGQGNHSLAVADVDGDGRDEIVYGACVIDDDGRGLYTTGLGHGDALHVFDIDPGRPGLEIWGIHERPPHPHGANLRDAATGRVLWSLALRDPGRGLALDIDPRYEGAECWASGSQGLYSGRGERIGPAPRSCNMGVWWDGDPQRELLDGRPARGADPGQAFIDKWDATAGTTHRLLDAAALGCATNNGTKANPCLCADILGDWREEVLWSARDGRSVRLFTSDRPTEYRRPCLMEDSVYRLAVAWQNVGYNQPAHLGGPTVIPAPPPPGP